MKKFLKIKLTPLLLLLTFFGCGEQEYLIVKYNEVDFNTGKTKYKGEVFTGEVLKSLLIVFLFFLYSCGSSPSLCDCLTTEGDLPSGCEQVFKDNYGTTDPSLKQMKNDYYNCK